MKKIRIMAFFLLCIMALTGSLFFVNAVEDGSGYQVDAKAAMLLDMRTGQSMLEQNIDDRVFPASLTKIMTAMLVLEHGNLDDYVVVSEEALQGLHEDGSTAGLLPGERLSVKDLLYCIMISSANEACNVAAEYISGSIADFVALMNERAAELGCTGTHFANSHGLHDVEHYTTVRDLCLITLAALQIPEFVTICTAKYYLMQETNLSPARRLYTTNYLISEHSTDRYYYSKAQGIKTGFTTPAGRCLISMASDGRKQLLAIVCGADTEVLESGDLLLHNFTEAKALFEHGFHDFHFEVLADPLNPLGKIPVTYSSTLQYAVFAPKEEVSMLLPDDFDPELVRQEIALDSEDALTAPVQKGERVGLLQVFYGEKLIGETALVTIADIARSDFNAVANEAVNFVHSPLLVYLLILAVVLLLLAAVLVLLHRSRVRRELRRREDAERREEMLHRLRGGDEP